MSSQIFYSVFVDPLRMFPEKRIFHMILRFRMHRHSYSNLGAIYAKYIWQTRKWLFFFMYAPKKKISKEKVFKKSRVTVFLSYFGHVQRNLKILR